MLCVRLVICVYGIKVVLLFGENRFPILFIKRNPYSIRIPQTGRGRIYLLSQFNSSKRANEKKKQFKKKYPFVGNQLFFPFYECALCVPFHLCTVRMIFLNAKCFVSRFRIHTFGVKWIVTPKNQFSPIAQCLKLDAGGERLCGTTSEPKINCSYVHHTLGSPVQILF